MTFEPTARLVEEFSDPAAGVLPWRAALAVLESVKVLAFTKNPYRQVRFVG